MDILTSEQVVRQSFKTIKLPGIYGQLVGDIERKSSIFVFGSQGSGKSTFTIGFARSMANFGKVIYVAAEEGHGLTVKSKLERLKAVDKNLLIATYSSLEELKKAIVSEKAFFVVLDSASVISPASKDAVAFAAWCKEKNIGILYIAHVRKTGGYKGDSRLAHDCDIVIEVTRDDDGEGSTASTSKNRYAELTSVSIDFTGKVPYGKHEMKSKPKQKRAQTRRNPAAPFHAQIGEIIKNHRLRSWNKLNRFLGVNKPCTFKGNPFAVFYARKDKQSALKVLVGGRVESEYCEPDFEACLKKFEAEYGKEFIHIEDEAHAKLVMGARAYNQFLKAQSKDPNLRVTSFGTKPKTTRPKPAPLVASRGADASVTVSGETFKGRVKSALRTDDDTLHVKIKGELPAPPKPKATPKPRAAKAAPVAKPKATPKPKAAKAAPVPKPKAVKTTTLPKPKAAKAAPAAKPKATPKPKAAPAASAREDKFNRLESLLTQLAS